jgi:hypothetical protein
MGAKLDSHIKEKRSRLKVFQEQGSEDYIWI